MERQNQFLMAFAGLVLSVFVLLATPGQAFAQEPWPQVGADIDGEATYDGFGGAVSLSADGTIMAAGARYNGEDASNTGHVRVYENRGGVWFQIGADIDGDVYMGNFGTSVSVSADGLRVAAGSTSGDGYVEIYENQGGTWVQVGNDINAEGAHDHLGHSISLNANGSMIAIGTPYNQGNGLGSGHVRVFADQGGVWVQVGEDIDGKAIEDSLGDSVSLSADGTIVAVGAPGNDDGGNAAGHVRVFENQGGTWVQIGADIRGKAVYDRLGYSVSLSADGTRVAASALNYMGGPVRVYENVSGNWIQIGDDILDDIVATYDFFGESVSLSADGTLIAIGAFINDDNGDDAGQVKIYEDVSGNWTQVGADINGEAAGDYSGYSVSLSADGRSVAIGARLNDGVNGGDSGHVRVFRDPSPAADLAILKRVEPATALPGDSITYTLSFTNAGPLAATNVSIMDVIPLSVINTSVISRGNALAPDLSIAQRAGTRYVWDVADLATGEGGVITITGELREALPAGAFTNTATIAAASDGNSADNKSHAAVTVLNLAPEAVADTYNTGTNVPLVIAAPGVLANDSDGNGDMLTAVLDDDSQISGTLDFNSDGSFVYTPTLDTNGSYTFTYHANDGALDSEVVTVSIGVSQYGSMPLFGDSMPSPLASVAVTYTYAITVTDADIGDSLVISATVLPAWLTFSDNGDGTALLSGLPSAADAGEHPVSLLVSDLGGWSDTQDFSVFVSVGRIYLPVILK